MTTSADSASPRVERARAKQGRAVVSLLVVTIAVAYGLGNVIYSAGAWNSPDIEAYWAAANRLREGQPLYVAVADVNAADVYRYSPWFAAAWIPLTFLPRELVNVLWSALLIGASIAIAVPVLAVKSRAAFAFAALVGSFLVLSASFGNVHTLVVGALAYGVERRSGPIWIALAASIKATPILYVIVYLVRRQWLRAGLAVAITAVLVAAMLPLGFGSYPSDPGWSHSLYAISPLLWAVVAGAAVAASILIAWKWPRYAWLAASLAVILSLPRYFPYELTYLFVGLVPAVGAYRRGGFGQSTT